jgi:hypothetical protein
MFEGVSSVTYVKDGTMTVIFDKICNNLKIVK